MSAIIYLIPPSGDFDSLSEAASRVGVTITTPQKLRELIVASAEGNVLVSTVSSQDLQIISRHTSALFDEMPSCVYNVPGLIYPGDWMTSAAIFPPIDWMELSRKWTKSGVTAYSTEDADSRDEGAPTRSDFSTDSEQFNFIDGDKEDDTEETDYSV